MTTDILNQLAQNHPFNKPRRELKKQDILRALPDFIADSDFQDWHLALHRFATVRPLCYHRNETIVDAIKYFEQDPTLTLDAIASSPRQLTHAVLSLIRPGDSWGREESLSLDNPTHILEFESIWHPEYQRYCEHIFNHLINIPLHILQLNKTKPRSPKPKDYVGEALSNRVNHLKSNGLASLTTGFNSNVRNSISHGQVDFRFAEIIYIDKNDRQELSASEFATLFDDIVDTCHSIVLASLLFLAKYKTLVMDRGLNNLPLGLRFMLVDGFVSHSNFQLFSMTESSVRGNQQQLNIIAKTDAKDRSIHLVEAMITCWHVASLGGAQYERYAISLDCGMKVTASLFLNGKVLSQAIENDWTVAQCAAAKLIEADLLWFQISKLQSRLNNWITTFGLLGEVFKRNTVKEWLQRGISIPSAHYTIRHIYTKNADKVRRIEAYVVLRNLGQINVQELEAILKNIFWKLRNHKVRASDFGKERGLPMNPSYVWVRLYTSDRRLRSFAIGGWKDKNFILQAEWFSRWSKIGPIYVKNPDSTIGRIRIKLNPNLIAGSDSNPASPGSSSRP